MGGQGSGKPVDNAVTAGPGLLREPQPPGTRQAGSGGCGADIRPGPQALALLLRLCGKQGEDLLVHRSSSLVHSSSSRRFRGCRSGTAAFVSPWSNSHENYRCRTIVV